MPDIKTREKVKGTVKTLDKAAVAGERMKAAYVRTKEKAEQGIQSKEDSPEEYAADRISAGSETVVHRQRHYSQICGLCQRCAMVQGSWPMAGSQL